VPLPTDGLDVVRYFVGANVVGFHVVGDPVPMSMVGDFVPKSVVGDAVPISAVGDAVPISEVGDAVPMTVVGDAVPISVVGDVVPIPAVGDAVPISAVGDVVPIFVVGLGVSSSDVCGNSVVDVLPRFTINGAGVTTITGLDVGSTDGSKVALSVTNGLVGSIVVETTGVSVPFGEMVGGSSMGTAVGFKVGTIDGP